MTRNAETEGAYVGRKRCGCLTLMVLEGCKDAAREVAKAIRAGDTIDRMTIEQAREVAWYCPEHPRTASKKQPKPKQETML